MSGFRSTHEGPCCESCLEDAAYSSDYAIFDADWVRLCCCREPFDEDEADQNGEHA